MEVMECISKIVWTEEVKDKCWKEEQETLSWKYNNQTCTHAGKGSKIYLKNKYSSQTN